MMSLLVDRSRRAASEGPALAEVHREIGSLLAVDVARRLPLEEYELAHPTGPSVGIQLVHNKRPVIVALLRAGLFLAEGLWARLPGSAMLLHSPGHGPFAEQGLEGRPTIIVDAVINTGRSIAPIIEAAHGLGASEVMVVTLVGYRPTLERMTEAMPQVMFTAARLSERSYVGKGGTDTGSRLFCTT
jgi:uracil phosphoribosyltransferase